MAKIITVVKIAEDMPKVQSAIQGILDKGRSVRVEIKSTSGKTDKQRAYYFGVIIPKIIEKFEDDGNYDWSEDDIHIFLKSLFLFESKEIDGKFFRMPKSLGNASVEEAAEYITKVCLWCSEQRIFIPLPNEK